MSSSGEWGPSTWIYENAQDNDSDLGSFISDSMVMPDINDISTTESEPEMEMEMEMESNESESEYISQTESYAGYVEGYLKHTYFIKDDDTDVYTQVELEDAVSISSFENMESEYYTAVESDIEYSEPYSDSSSASQADDSASMSSDGVPSEIIIIPDDDVQDSNVDHSNDQLYYTCESGGDEDFVYYVEQDSDVDNDESQSVYHYSSNADDISDVEMGEYIEQDSGIEPSQALSDNTFSSAEDANGEGIVYYVEQDPDTDNWEDQFDNNYNIEDNVSDIEMADFIEQDSGIEQSEARSDYAYSSNADDANDEQIEYYVDEDPDADSWEDQSENSNHSQTSAIDVTGGRFGYYIEQDSDTDYSQAQSKDSLAQNTESNSSDDSKVGCNTVTASNLEDTEVNSENSNASNADQTSSSSSSSASSTLCIHGPAARMNWINFLDPHFLRFCQRLNMTLTRRTIGRLCISASPCRPRRPFM